MSAMMKRFTVTVPDSVYEDLERWADEQGRPTANLAALLIELGIRQAVDRGELPPKSKEQSATKGNRS
jgi:hypothetical protein